MNKYDKANREAWKKVVNGKKVETVNELGMVCLGLADFLLSLKKPNKLII